MSTYNQNHDLTTVVIKKTTRQALKHRARKGQSYDDLLNELMKLSNDKNVMAPQEPQQQDLDTSHIQSGGSKTWLVK